MWTLFWDMHSGGGTKEPPYENIYIEAPQDEAIVIFYNRFGHNPNRVSCTCCGGDYSISENEELSQVSGFHRGCKYDREANRYVEEETESRFFQKGLQTIEEHKKNEDVLVIEASDIQDHERVGDVPTQGFVWADE